ncbi:CPBP family intramembrane glutamic endopeptidase [Clostridium cuniculi]|uniref:CPBP family intramembrane glutamic endopeptidase n=1 Tax=Clostridium cuniculi TaxID=2548455 RepID=UPI00105419CB|nr:type II CAAX endopeptidase family protein [Clostridium cuniculi]
MLRKYKIQILLIYYLVFMIILINLPITANIMIFIAKDNVIKASEYLTIIFYFSHFILFIIGFLSFRGEIKIKLKDFALNWKKNLKYIAIGFISIIIANIIVGMFIQQQGSNQETLSYMQQGSAKLMLICFYLVTVIIGPINEELIFRRIFIGEGRKYLSIFSVLILSSVIFGLIHIHNIKEIIVVIPYICTGLILGFIYYKSDNVITSSLLHILNNLIGIIILAIA